MNDHSHILVCEDNSSVVLVTSFALESEGFEVEIAKSTSELFLKLKSDKKPSLILLDLNIPEAGGEFVIQQLRNSEDTKNIPVILFSAEKDLEEITAQLKADGFIRKPFDVAYLTTIVKRFIK